MPAGLNVTTVTATGDPTTDRANWFAAVASLPPQGKLIYDGLLAFDDWVWAGKPLVHVGIDGRSGVALSGGACLYLNGAPDLANYALDTLWEGADAGGYAIRLPQAFAATLQPLDWIFLYSTDELTGMTPHMGGKQFPGECHQVLEISSPVGGLTTVYLRDALKDSMHSNPRVNRRPMQSGTVVENFCLVRGGTLTSARAMGATDIAGLRLFGVTVEGAGPIVINGPDAMTDQVYIRYQEDYNTQFSEDDNWYGIVMGATAANFRVRGKFHNCKHACDTSGQTITVNGVQYRCGTPWGTFSVDASGTYEPVLHTHAEGKGIIFDGCSVSTVNQTNNPYVNYGFAIGSREVTIRNCRVYGGGPTIGVQVGARGCRILNSEFTDCWLGVFLSQLLSDDCLIKNNVFDRMWNAGVVSIYAANRTKIIGNEFLDCARNYYDPPSSQSVITLDGGTGHVIRGNSIRRADNLMAVASIDVKSLPASAVELLGNDFTGWTNYGLAGTQAAAIHTVAQRDNYPRTPDAGGNTGILILSEGAALGTVGEIDFRGEPVSVSVHSSRATVTLSLPVTPDVDCCHPGMAIDDMLHDGQSWLACQLHAFVATEVTYVRGNQSVVLRATIGRTLLKLDDGYGGVRMVRTDRDYLIRPADLVLGGIPAQPLRGDQIRETVGEQTLVYEVLAPGDEPPWRWADPHRQMLRIHTKQIAIEV